MSNLDDSAIDWQSVLQVDAENFQLSNDDLEQIRADCSDLDPLLVEFPTLRVLLNILHYERSNAYESKLSIVTPGQTISTRETAGSWNAAFNACLQKAHRRVKHYREIMQQQQADVPAYDAISGTVDPTQQLDGAVVSQAIESDDYLSFRKAMWPLEPALRRRVSEWLRRYPDLESMILADDDAAFSTADLVEEVFMLAFDQYGKWPREMFFGQWIETLIDPALENFANDPAGEAEKINYIRSALEV